MQDSPGRKEIQEGEREKNMSVSVEKLENSMAKLTIEVAAEKLDEAINTVYKKERNRITIPGFRKGKAPRAVIERMYGREVFYEQAADALVQEAYPSAMDESGEDIVSSPKISVEQIESGKPFIFTAEVALKPPVGLGKYKGIEIEKIDTSVTDEEVEEELERQRKMSARDVTVTGRPVQADDIVKLDYEGMIDGVPFDGGKAEEQLLTIGSGTFIPGFEDQLIGQEAGAHCDVKVTFPESYHEAKLSGKEAVFHCFIHEIREKKMPELDDDFASDVSEYETMAEFREGLKKQLSENKEKEAQRTREDECVKALIADSDINLPEPMVETQQRQMVNDFAMQLQMQGMSYPQYMQMMGQNEARMMEQMRPQAIERIKARLVLEAVAKAEGFAVSDEEYAAKLEEVAKNYRLELDRVKELTGEKEEKDLRDDILMEKAAKFLVDNAKATKAPKKKEEKAGDKAEDDGEKPKRAIPRRKKKEEGEEA